VEATTAGKAASEKPRAGESSATAVAPEDATVRGSVAQAFSLGWNLCRLYLSGSVPRRPSWSKVPKRLPTPSRFSEAERSLIRLGQVRASIERLDERVAARAGQPSLGDATAEHIARLDPSADGGNGDDPRRSLCEAHLALAQSLSCSDPRLAKAYHLGVSLATTCHAPDDLASLKNEFNRYRIAQLGEWLADLTALFPNHSSRAVRLSCGSWRRWVDDPQVEAAKGMAPAGKRRIRKATARARGLTRDLNWRSEGIEVRRALARQGEVWRALLSGEKPGTAMLELRDYVKAGARALMNAMRLARGVWPVLVLAFVLFVLGVVLVLSGAKLSGLIALVGSVGITWKGVADGVGGVMERLQDPVWGAALDEEVAGAITTLPPGASLSSQEVEDAAPAAGPQPDVLALPEEVEQKPEMAP
jgi:hypothetical protein